MRIALWIYLTLTVLLTVITILSGGFWFSVIGAVCGGFMVGVIIEHRYGQHGESS